MSPSQKQDTVELSSEQVLELPLETLQEHLSLIVQSNAYTAGDIWRILVSVSAEASTVEETTGKMEEGPCANTVRPHLKEGLLSQTEL